MVFRWRFMGSRFRFLLPLFLVLSSAGLGSVAAQEPASHGESPSDPPPKAAAPAPEILVAQTTLPNPVKDVIALIHREQFSGKPDEPITSLPGIIRVQYSASGFGYAWDPVECRLMFVWQGGADMSDLKFVAEGPAPFAATIGAWGVPDYFGYRLVDGAPEFLYYVGSLGVTEKIRPTPDGRGWTQDWEIHQADYGLQVTIPERWVSKVKASAGDWIGPVLKLPESKVAKLTLTWIDADAPDLPELAASWNGKPKSSPENEAPKSESETKQDE